MKLIYIAPIIALATWSADGDAATKSRIAEEPGTCKNYTLLDAEFLKGKPIPPGNYYFKMGTRKKLDVELVAGGGGGGAAANAYSVERPRPNPPGDNYMRNFVVGEAGGGGGAGQYLAGHYSFDAARYFVKVGAGGAGGASPSGNSAPDGAGGGDTVIGRCVSGLDFIPRQHGGSGGKGDGEPDRNRGGQGTSLRNPATNEVVGTGGQGGSWQNDGQDAGGSGSGGGGQGGTTVVGRHGGKGGDGFARLWSVGLRLADQRRR